MYAFFNNAKYVLNYNNFNNKKIYKFVKDIVFHLSKKRQNKNTF